MKKYNLYYFASLICLSLLSFPVMGQPSWSFGYLGHMGYQPGLKISKGINLKEIAPGKNATRYLAISPYLGFYSWSQNNLNFLVGNEWGIRLDREKKGKFSSITMGTSYLLESRKLGVQVSLADGNTQANRETRHFFLPSIHYAFGGPINSRLGWYNKYGIGSKMASGRESQGLLFVELGLTLN